MDTAMTKYQCKTCGGIYFDEQPDGIAYYHTCPWVEDKDGNISPNPDARDENPGKDKEGKGREKMS